MRQVGPGPAFRKHLTRFKVMPLPVGNHPAASRGSGVLKAVFADL